MYLVKSGELFLKGKNHKFFENKLIKSIKNYNNKVINFHNQYLVVPGNNLNKIFGVSNYYKVKECQFGKIKETALKLIKEEKSFRIRAKRSDKKYKTSLEIEKETADYILKNKNIKLNLSNPQITIYVFIIKNKAYISNKKFKGLGGLPIECEAEVLIKVNNEKLSTVAGFLLLKRGCVISSTKELPLIKKYYKYSIKRDSDVLALDEISPVKVETNKLILRPLIGLTHKEINDLYSFIKK